MVKQRLRVPVTDPVLLMVSEEPELALELAAALEPRGIKVVRAYGGADALEQARGHLDAILADWNLTDMTGPELCTALQQRDERNYTPILLTTGVVPGREERLAAMRAGAWDILIHPIDPEELELKLTRYVNAKRTADWALAEYPIDPLTGLFSASGLLRQAMGAVSLAARQDAAVACAVLEAQANGAGAEGDALAKRLADVFRDTARASDVIARTASLTFVVVAPATSADGARRLLERLSAAIRTAESQEDHLQIRAGYEAVDSARRQAITAHDLLHSAESAAHSAWFGSADRWLVRHSGSHRGEPN
jgi:PleD family two-component response regulator